jgi:hypothetical protein
VDAVKSGMDDEDDIFDRGSEEEEDNKADTSEKKNEDEDVNVDDL